VNAVLLDTHAWTWSLTGDERLSSVAASAITGADSVWVSPISFFEIGQKVRIGKWPEMVPYIDDLPQLLQEQGGRVAQMTPDIALRASVMVWEHRDPFDRILAVTAMLGGMPIVSADEIFDTLADISRIW